MIKIYHAFIYIIFLHLNFSYYDDLTFISNVLVLYVDLTGNESIMIVQKST
jgi:hypothetical protein